jgi:hypothetical protein
VRQPLDLSTDRALMLHELGNRLIVSTFELWI